MSQIAYPESCDNELLSHVCDACLDLENARVRGVALIHKNFTFTNPADENEWTQGILDGDIVVIPDTHGTYDGGTPDLGQGYGDVPNRVRNTTFVLTWYDPNLAPNASLFNVLRTSRNWKVAWITSSKVRISDVAATHVPKDPVEDDLNGEVVWEVESTFIQQDHPLYYDVPDGVFQCFTVTP